MTRSMVAMRDVSFLLVFQSVCNASCLIYHHDHKFWFSGRFSSWLPMTFRQSNMKMQSAVEYEKYS